MEALSVPEIEPLGFTEIVPWVLKVTGSLKDAGKFSTVILPVVVFPPKTIALNPLANEDKNGDPKSIACGSSASPAWKRIPTLGEDGPIDKVPLPCTESGPPETPTSLPLMLILPVPGNPLASMIFIPT